MYKALLIFLIIGITTTVLSKYQHFYRKDYTYIEEYDAFYKLHWDTSGWSWNSAFMACDNEGAKLFYPKGNEWTVVKNLSDAMVVPPNTTEMYVGLHNEFGLGEFITVDGRPTDSPLNFELDVVDGSHSEDPDRCMLMDYTTGQFRVDSCFGGPDNSFPFVCKKVDEESCPTIDHNYKYVSDLKKCYKINNRPKTWQAAMQTCYMEGGVLAVLEDNHIVKDVYNQNYFIGLRKSFSSGDFYTVKGQIYDDSELKRLSMEYSDRSCGILSYEYNPPRVHIERCTNELPFICEMNANNRH